MYTKRFYEIAGERLKLPIPVSEISDYDQNAPFVF